MKTRASMNRTSLVLDQGLRSSHSDSILWGLERSLAPTRKTSLWPNLSPAKTTLLAVVLAFAGVASAWAEGRVWVTAATGGGALPATTAGGAWTTLTGPVLMEGGEGSIKGPGTIVLTVPEGFEFNSNAIVTALVQSFRGATPTDDINGVPSGGTIPVSVTATTLTLLITSDSTGGNNPNTLTFQNIQVRPTAGSPLASGNLIESGTCDFQTLTLANGTWGFLSEVDGPLAGYLITGTNYSSAGVPISITIQKVDQFGNPISDSTTENLVFSGIGTVGNYAPTVNGSTNAFTSGIPVTFDTNGSTTVTLVDYLAGTGTLNVTDGTKSSTGGLAITVAPGPASVLNVVSAPVGVTYGSTFDVAVQTTDQYGNTSNVGLGSSVSVTLALASGPGSLLGTVTQDMGTSAGNGTADFSAVQISAAADNDVLSANAGGFVSGTATISVAPLVVIPSVAVGNKVYDGTTAASIVGRSLAGAVVGDDVSLGLSGVAAFQDQRVGTGKPVGVTGLGLTGGAAPNYLLSTTSFMAAADISAAPLTVSADNLSRMYGTANPILTGSMVGVLSGDSITASYSTAAQADSPVGNYSIIPSLIDPNSRLANYSVTVNNGTLAITPAGASTSLSSSLNPVVQGSNVTFSATVSPVAPASGTPTGNVQFLLNGQPLGNPVALNAAVATLNASSLSAGSNTISAVYLGDANFTDTGSGSNSLTEIVQMNISAVNILSITRNSEGIATVLIQGVPGTTYLVQATSDLTPPSTWVNVSTNVANFIDGKWTYVEQMQFPQRFFRAANP